MEKLMLFPYTRRSRCDVPSCKEFADYQIGVKMNRPMVTLDLLPAGEGRSKKGPKVLRQGPNNGRRN